VTADEDAKLKGFFSAFAGGATPFLLLDYDGTLAPFRLDRFQARPWAGVREALTRIQRQGRTRMVLITGRPAHEIAPLLGLDQPFEVWGLHGAEHLLPDGRRELEPASSATSQILTRLRAMLRCDSLGGLFEDKANGVVMHWRGVSPGKARQIEAKARALFEPLAGTNGLALLEFEAGLELRAGCDKGGAVEAILREALAGGLAPGPVAYVGDDFTDEAAFRAVKNAGPLGLAVLMRRQWHPTAADIWLRPPTELREFLARWLSATQTGSKAQPRGRDR
jgi:trehalose-phosphatase